MSHRRRKAGYLAPDSIRPASKEAIHELHSLSTPSGSLSVPVADPDVLRSRAHVAVAADCAYATYGAGPAATGFSERIGHRLDS